MFHGANARALALGMHVMSLVTSRSEEVRAWALEHEESQTAVRDL